MDCGERGSCGEEEFEREMVSEFVSLDVHNTGKDERVPYSYRGHLEWIIAAGLGFK